MTDAWLSALVRVVALDGSVWWVKPAMVPYYAALTSAFAYTTRG